MYDQSYPADWRPQSAGTAVAAHADGRPPAPSGHVAFAPLPTGFLPSQAAAPPQQQQHSQQRFLQQHPSPLQPFDTYAAPPFQFDQYLPTASAAPGDGRLWAADHDNRPHGAFSPPQPFTSPFPDIPLPPHQLQAHSPVEQQSYAPLPFRDGGSAPAGFSPAQAAPAAARQAPYDPRAVEEYWQRERELELQILHLREGARLRGAVGSQGSLLSSAGSSSRSSYSGGTGAGHPSPPTFSPGPTMFNSFQRGPLGASRGNLYPALAFSGDRYEPLAAEHVWPDAGQRGNFAPPLSNALQVPLPPSPTAVAHDWLAAPPTAHNVEGLGGSASSSSGGDALHVPVDSKSSPSSAKTQQPAARSANHATSSSRKPSSASASVKSGGKKKRILGPGDPIATCNDCAEPLAHLLLRGEEDDFEVEWDGVWLCKRCMDRRRKNGIGGVAEERTGSLRKRKREAQDIQALVICDVCLIVKGQGGIVPKDGKSAIAFTTEFVCTSCHSRYQRCTDCGGGGGGRIGIGKWRSKELFAGKRKTCSLSHTRIGASVLTSGVWDVRDFWDVDAREALLEKCAARWRDRTLARLAVPEILETDDGTTRSFADIEAALSGGWPSREAVFEGIETPWREEKRRFFGLTWCPRRPRRKAQAGKAADSASPEQSQAALAEELNSVDIIPPDHDLVGLFLAHWNMPDGTLLITTSLPFDTTDGDDRTAVAVKEVIAKISTERAEINERRLADQQAGLSPHPPALLPPLAHLWVLCGDNPNPQHQERMLDLLVRRRGFHRLDDYLQLHPHVSRDLFRINTCYMPLSGPAWIVGGEEIDLDAGEDRECEILVRRISPPQS